MSGRCVMMEGVLLMKDAVFLPKTMAFSLMDVAVDPVTEQMAAYATSTSPEAACPVCGQTSARVQSRYTRTLADLPWAGRQVQWHVQVRRFRCENGACPRKIFTERLPMWAPAYAHRTSRQAEPLRNVASALGGKGGERLVTLLGMAASHDTLLRLLRRSETAASPPPRVLGVDDFAWKKGDRYGTILIDQERHTVVDVLPDREAATFATWLRAHEGVEIISRDRAGAYAEGARQGAPHAIQVSDRFHLLVNLRTALLRLFERNHPLVSRVTTHSASSTGTGDERTTASIQMDKRARKASSLKREQQQARRTRRHERYEDALTLHKQGFSQNAIAAQLGIARDTVHRYLTAPAFPEIVRPRVC